MRCGETKRKEIKMTKQELIQAVIRDAKDLAGNMPSWADQIGVRYDNIEVVVGQELEHSISNHDRDDSREFPAYDADAERMEGTSCYAVCQAWDDVTEELAERLGEYLSGQDEACWDHCSLIIGESTDEVGEDDGEWILGQPEVVKVYW